ncbi:extracellular catalytic domain type 1 short-chain-length polyhydroxyalkanoate depolymerase [Chitinimonas sp. PSY-7]|uniref:extracellular catalytic domain type 1 short-chain-length polyhydroxyalkanoate depolymerase n=1 Tax=Chitinimonas sp. PSY-7 TaxID=3459088 RepID=UPI0040403AB6
MIERMQNMMREATRLTAKGRLLDATLLIQRSLHLRTTPCSRQTPAVTERMPIEGLYQVIDTPYEQNVTITGNIKPSVPNIPPEKDVESGFLNGTYGCAAGTRDYKLYIPSAYQGQPLPLIVMLHGCKQNPDDFAAGTQMNEVGEQHQCFVLYPAQSNQANSTSCWNWFRESDQQRGRGEPAIIANMTQEVMQRYRIDKTRVYVAGLSAGGAMAVVMGKTYPDLYAAVGVHSGIPYAAATDIPSALAAMQQGLAKRLRRVNKQAVTNTLPTIVFHGDSDTTVHPRNGDHVIKQTRAGSSNTSEAFKCSSWQGSVPQGHHYTVSVHRNEQGEPVVEHWVVHGGGHAWSGGSKQGTYTDSMGPNASQEMVRFFLEHPAASRK